MKSMMLFAVVVSMLAFSGCAETTASGRISSYSPGQMFGDSGATPCLSQNGIPLRSDVDGGVPFCGYPSDGDTWDPRNQ